MKNSDKIGKFFQNSIKWCIENFRKIIVDLESEEEKREIYSIMILSQAWQKMAQADIQDFRRARGP